MNFSSLIGLMMALIVCIGGAVTSTKDWKVFLDWHAVLIVVGGTVAASLLSFSGSKMLALLKIFFKRVLGKNEEMQVAITEIVLVAKGYRENEKFIKVVIPKIKTHFFREAP